MMNLKVIGTGCEDCDRLYENTKQAVAQLGIEAELEKVRRPDGNCEIRRHDCSFPDEGWKAHYQRSGCFYR